MQRPEVHKESARGKVEVVAQLSSCTVGGNVGKDGQGRGGGRGSRVEATRQAAFLVSLRSGDAFPRLPGGHGRGQEGGGRSGRERRSSKTFAVWATSVTSGPRPYRTPGHMHARTPGHWWCRGVGVHPSAFLGWRLVKGPLSWTCALFCFSRYGCQSMTKLLLIIKST